MLETANGNLVLVHLIPTQEGLVALCERKSERVHTSNELKRKGVNALDNMLGHPLEEITQTIGKAMGLKLTGMFRTCKACALGRAEKANVSKTTILHSMIKGKRLFIDVSSPSTASMGGKQHRLLVVKDNTNYA